MYIPKRHTITLCRHSKYKKCKCSLIKECTYCLYTKKFNILALGKAIVLGQLRGWGSCDVMSWFLLAGALWEGVGGDCDISIVVYIGKKPSV